MSAFSDDDHRGGGVQELEEHWKAKHDAAATAARKELHSRIDAINSRMQARPLAPPQ